jgi:hypothetical protein
MTLSLTLAAIRRHAVSVLLTFLILLLTTALIGAPAILAISIWVGVAALSYELWYALEPTILTRIARYREPTHAERQRLDSALGGAPLRLLVADTTDLVAIRGLRCLVLSRDLLDVFEDRALSGLLNQTAAPIRSANLAGFALVWLGNLPLLVAWWADCLAAQLGRLLAVVVGTSLVLPLILFRDVFLCWTGRLFAAMLVSLIGGVLVSGGHAAAGLGILSAWLIVPLVQAILAWESRRAEAAADKTTIAAGYGLQLLEAVDFLALAEPLPVADKLLSLLCLPRSTSVERADRIRHALGASDMGS